VGTWEGDQGVDVSFHNDKGKIAETPFREKTTFKPFGPVENGDQVLYGLDYRTAAWRAGEDNPFHTEVGYWMWDLDIKQVMRCFMIPRASTLIAGGTVEPDATKFTLASELGSNTYGILSNSFLDEIARCVRYDCTISVEGDTFTYDETSVIEHKKLPDIILHTDRNVLTRVSWEA